MNSFFTPKQQSKVQVENRDELCKALAEQMIRPDVVNYTVCYTDLNDPDGRSPPSVQKHNAKQISMSIVRRVALKCPNYQWIRKTAQSTPHTIKNGFICALAEQCILPDRGQRKSCNGALAITIIRRVPGQFTISVTLEHDFAHASCAIAAAAAAPIPSKAPTTTVFSDATAASSLAPTQRVMHPLPARKSVHLAPRSQPGESIAKDVLRALGLRPRTPELVTRSLNSTITNKNKLATLPTNENKLPVVVEEAVKRGRGRPKKEADPNAPKPDPNAPKKPRGRPRKDALPIVPLAVNRTVSNQTIMSDLASKNTEILAPTFIPTPIVQM